MPKSRRDLHSSRPDVDYPEGFPEEAREFWPDLSRWPSATDVDRFVKGTRRNPDARLAVLTGLRRYSSVNLGTIWAWVASFVPVVLALVSTTTSIEWLSTIAAIIAAAVLVWFLIRLLTMSSSTDVRRRSALVWLHAFEDAIASSQRRRFFL